LTAAFTRTHVCFAGENKIMKYKVTAIAAISSMICLTCGPRAQAGHSIRIDEGNGAGCMSTWTNISDPTGAAAFIPGGTYTNAVECTASGAPSVLFPNGLSANDAATSPGNSGFTATSGEMFQYYTGAVGAVPNAQIALWQLITGPFGAQETEVELNGWCLGGSGASFTYGGVAFTGPCGASTDLLFSHAGSLVGYVTDASDGTATIHAGASVPGLTQSGRGTLRAPEIDPSAAFAGFTLLAGGLAVLRGDRRPLVRVR
jgi:hypothetical protein